MKIFFNSLTFKVGAIIILVEIVTLTVVGIVYINRFSAEIDRRTIARAEVPGNLINSRVMSVLSTAREGLMERLVGEDLVDWLVVNRNGKVSAALNPAEPGKDIRNLPRLNPDWFSRQITEAFFEKTSDTIISVTPLPSIVDSDDISFHIYVKMSREEAKAEEQVLIRFFILWSLVTVILTSIAILLLFNATVLNRIKGLLGVLEQIESGDLTARVSGPVSSDEMGGLQRGVNSMAAQLGEMVGTLEQRVAERSHALELSAEVSRRLSTILDQEQLMAEVVEQVRLAFDYYYIQIYLFDEAHENLVLTRGTGKAGRAMLARKHSLPKDRGLVGRVAERNTQILVPDVFRGIGVEIVTSSNVVEVYRRETDQAFETRWYADWLTEFFSEVETARQLAEQQSATDEVIQIGYVLCAVNDFTDVIQRGARAAARDLRVELEITGPSFAYEHLPLFEALISKGKDGLVTIPQGEGWPAAIQQAIKTGIPVMAANVESPLTGITNVAQDNFQSGSVLAREITKLLVAEGKEQGKIILGPGISDRIEGFMHGIRNTDYAVIQIDKPEEFTELAARAYWKKAVNDHPDLIAAVGLLPADIPVLAELKRDSGGKWFVAGYDLSIETLEAIRTGVAQITIGQHLYLQGYLPVLALVEHLRRGKSLEGWMTEGWLPNPLLPKTKAEITVPIAIGEEVLGVLDVQHNVAGSLTPEDVNLLQSIADQVAIGLQNVRLVAHLETALAETHAAHERYLEQSWEKARIVTQGGQYHYARPDAPALDEPTLVEATQKALTQSHPTTVTLDGSEDEEPQGQPAKSIVAPISLPDKTIGALHLHPARDGREWAEDDLAIVEAVVDQLAQSAESLRLFEDTRQRASREQAIREITDKLRAAPNLDALLETAARELSQRLGVRHTVLELGIEAGQEGDGLNSQNNAGPEVE